MNTNDLAFIHFSTVAREQLAAILQAEQRERYRFARPLEISTPF